jgi:hypothetical protein
MECEREVSIAEGLRMSQRFGCEFYETSAQTSQIAKKLFIIIVRLLRSSNFRILPVGLQILTWLLRKQKKKQAT